jgi:hypothetical protein
MTQETQIRGLIMIKQMKRVIDQLQDDPDFKGMIGASADNPDESQVGPSDSKLRDIDEIVG